MKALALRDIGYGMIMFSGIAIMLADIPLKAEGAESARQSYDLLRIIDLAVERNPVMVGARGVIDQSAGQRVTAGAYPNPTIKGDGGRGFLRDAGPLTAEIPTSANEYFVSAGQPIEWPSKRAARQLAAEAGLAGATAGLVEARLNLTTDVKLAFYDLLLAQRDEGLARQNLEIVKDVQRIVNTRVRLGEAPQFEAIKAQVEVLKADQVVTRAENAVQVNRVILDTLTVGALGADYTIDGEFRYFPKDLDLVRLITLAMDQHPSIQRLSKSVEQADRNIQFERHARVPNVTFSGSYAREYGREGYDFGVSVPTPIWYQQQGQIATALGAKRTEEAALLRTRNLLVKEVNQYFQDAETTAHLIEVFEKGLLKQAQEALRIAQFSFQQGAVSLLEVLDAQRVQQQILFDYAHARFELSIALIRLERAAGGLL
ncbi:MAG TPA: TolC family protein [Nitrospiraceae bacterium]|nr:TolC family protein [Nitrospiraceae bacterium]